MKFGPKSKIHPSVGEKCPACGKPFEAGDFTTFIALGPGDDPDAQKAFREDRPYNAVAIEVHYDCARNHLIGYIGVTRGYSNHLTHRPRRRHSI